MCREPKCCFPFTALNRNACSTARTGRSMERNSAPQLQILVAHILDEKHALTCEGYNLMSTLGGRRRRLSPAVLWTVNVASLVRSACSRLGVTCLLSLLLLPSAATHHGNGPYEVIQGRPSKERVLPTEPTIGSPRTGVPTVAT